MNTYHKIQTVFKRDPSNNYKTLLLYEYSLPEFKYLSNNQWVFTEKVDGNNIRVMYKDKQIVGYGTLSDMVAHAQTSFESQWGNFTAEGIVARPATELVTRNDQRIITKLKCKDFQS